jgi:hypothetical protein
MPIRERWQNCVHFVETLGFCGDDKVGSRLQELQRSFAYSLIPDMLTDLLPWRPAFPPEPQEWECPHCKTKSTHHPIDLRFKDERRSPVR